MSQILSTGKEILLSEFHPGEMFGELIVFTGANYRGWLKAEEDSEVIEIKRDELFKLLKEDDNLLAFMKEVAQRVSRFTESMEILSYKTISRKAAYYLLSRHVDGKVNLNVSQLSNRLGCSREALSRTLTQLEQINVIKRHNGCIQIHNREKLEDLLFS